MIWLLLASSVLTLITLSAVLGILSGTGRQLRALQTAAVDLSSSAESAAIHRDARNR